MEIGSYERKLGGLLAAGSDGFGLFEEGHRRGEIQSDIDSSELATLIVSTLEGSLMMSRLQRGEQPRDWACRHLEEYLESKVRVKDSKGRAKKP
jgi:hypothetical protein